MKRCMALGVMVLLLLSTFSYPFLIAETKGVGRNTKAYSPSQAPDLEAPNIAVEGVDYSYINSTHMRVYANITNYGGDSGAFNVTFKAILPQNLPQPAQIQFKWVNITSELQNASEVHSGDYVEGESAVLKADDGFFVYRLPFILNYFGREIVSISVSTNGYIELLGKWEEPQLGDYYGVHEDGLYRYDDVIFALDDDLETEDGYLAVVQFGDKVVVEWLGSTYEDYDSSQYPVHFQVVIFRNGTIRWSYNLLRYSEYSYDLFAGYYSKVSMEENEIPKAEKESFEVQLPDVSSFIFKVPISGLSNGASTEVHITLPIQDIYVEVIADDEEILNESYRYDNVGDIGIWPGDYWIENAAIGNMTVGEYTTINVTVKTTSSHPEDALIGLMLNNQTVWEGRVTWNEFINGTAQKAIWWRVQGGEYDLRLWVYAQGDLNTSNNYYHLGHYSLPQPNLRIVNYSIEIPQCVGSQAVIKANITNDGDGNWSYVSVKFTVGYRTPRSFWTTVSVPAGETVQAQVSFGVLPGNISWIHIDVDPSNSVFESNESDNYVNATYTVSIPYPDFVVDSFDVPENPAAGNVYEINATILNAGGCYNGEVRVNLYEEDYRVAYKYIVPNTTVSFSWRPRGMGYRNLSVVVNPYHSIAERDYSNNVLSRVVYVQGPDIVITNVTLVRFSGIAGSRAVFNVTVRNLGETFTSGFYIRTRNALSNDYSYISGGLKKGEERWALLEPILNGGNYSLVFIADYWDDVPEANESNNFYHYSVEIPMPNFIVEKVELPDNTVGDIPVNITIKNTGAPFNASWNYIPVRVRYGDHGQESIYIWGLLDTNATALGETTVRIQAPGAVFNVTVNPFGDINETSYSDNGYALNYTTGYPDLLVEISVPENISAGEMVYANLTVKNVGNATLRVDRSLWGTNLGLSVLYTQENGNIQRATWEMAPITLTPGGMTTKSYLIVFNGGLNNISAYIDSTENWKESNEVNNRAELLVNVNKPDFTLSNYLIPQEILNGSAYLYKRYQINANVTNLGGDFVNYLYVYLYDNGEYEDSISVRDLMHNETKEISLDFTPTPGYHVLEIKVDPSNRWIESNELDNNVTIANVSFDYPDLTPVGVTWEPYNFTAGENVVFSAFVENLGQRFYKYFTIRFEIYNGTSMIAYGSGYPSPYSWYFDTNETKEFRWTWYNAKPGNLTVKIVADYYNAIEEENETNNEFTAEIGSVGTPDFELGNLTVGEMAYGKAVDINVTLRNLGESIYRPFSVLFNISDELHYVTVYGMAANETRTVTYRWYVNRVGDVEISVKADPSDLIVEADETNNEVSGSYFVKVPELWIESYSWVEDDLARGYVTFRVNVTNSGGSTYRGFYLAMYIDGTRKVRRWIPSLLSGESREETLSWRVDAGGEHEVLLVVDDGNLIPETDEANNAVRTNVTVELPDIEVENIFVPEMHANAVFTVNVTLRNSGIEDIERPFLVAIFQDGRYLGGTFVSSLPAGSSSTVGIAVRPYPGDSILKVVADYYGSIVETNETNNEFLKGIHVKAPDIRVISLFPGTPEYSGEEINATVIIRNIGDYGTGTFYIALRHGEKTLGGIYVRNILPGEERNVSVTWKADAGRYNLTAIADPYGAIREWDEDNNAVSTEVSVPAPDLRVVKLEHSDVTAGERMDFKVVIENTGERTLLPFYVGIYANTTLVAVRRVYGIAPGMNVTINFENAWKARYGRYTIRAVVDINDEISEEREDNNWMETSVSIADEKAPMLMRTYPGNGSFTNEPLIGALLSDEGSGVDYSRTEMRLYLNGAQVEGSAAVSWGWLVFRNSTPLEDGNYTVLLRAVDRAGNSKEYRWWFVLDRKAPEIETNVLNGTLYNGTFTPEINVTDANLKEYRITVNGRDYHGEAIRTDGSYLLEVVALDRAGNEARYSVWFRVNGIPRPPSGLLVNVSDNYVTLSWFPSGDSDIAGYYVYRDGVRLNEEPVEVTTFRDVFTGSLNYSVTAVDYMGFESEPARVFPARLMITAGKAYVGYPLRVYVDVENLDGYANGSLSLQLVDVFGNVIDELERKVELPEGRTRVGFEVAVPYGLGSLRAVLTVGDSSTQAILPVEPVEAERPEITVGKLQTGLPGLVEVRVRNYGDGTLDTSGAILQLGGVSGEPIGSLPKIEPGEEAILRYRVVPEERGTYNLTFRLGGLVTIEEVEVEDPVANPLMILTENLVRGGSGRVYVTFRNIGSAPLRVTRIEVLGMRKELGVYLPPNLSVGASFVYSVPANASELTVRATVFTDVGTFERTVTVKTEEPPYNANVTLRSVFTVGETVEIEGFAYNESGLLANVPVKVSIVRGDFVREYLLITDASGHFRMSFRPFRNEAGHFVVSATHPSVLVPERDAEFDIVGLTLVPEVYKLTVTKEFSGEIEVELINHWRTSNVSVEVSAPMEYNVSVPGRIELKEGSNRIKIGLSSENAVNGTLVITFRTTQLGMEIEKNLTVNITVLPPAPRIVVEPRSLQVGILTNETKGVTLKIKNTGFETLRNVSVSSSIDWIRIVSNFTELEAGKDASVGLYIAPPDNATGTFEGRLRISSSNHRDVYVPVRITVTPNATSSLLVTVMDPNATRLEGAEVTLYNGYAHFEGTTDENGTVVFRDVPVGDYTLIVGEESHYTSERQVTLEPGVEGNVTVVLMPSVLEIEWEVVPVTIEDVYVIKHEIGYTTYVPAPEIESYGGDLEVYIDYDRLAELGVIEFRGQLIVRNTHRYVSVFNITFESGGSHYIDVEFLVDRIDELKPGETVVVPYVVRVYYQRSPPINPCLHETTVFTLRAGVVCVEEAGKITLRAEKVHKIIVKPTCDGCWKALLNIAAHIAFEKLTEKLGDVFEDNEIMKDSGEKIVESLKELYEAYYQMSMNPTDENRKNFAETYKKVKASILGILKNASLKYGEKYIEDYLSAQGVEFDVITDGNGNVVGFISSPMDGYMYPSVMSVVQMNGGNIQIDWGKAKELADELTGGLISELEDAAKKTAENLPVVKVLDLIVKLVDDYTPRIAEAAMNCMVCILGNNCTPPNLGNPEPIQLIRSGYFLGYTGGEAGTGGAGGGGGETSVGRFTCEGLPKPKNSTTTQNSQSTTCSSCSQSFGLPRERKVCVNVPLKKPLQLPAQEDDTTNTLHMCVDLVITIEQRLTFERQAFRASLKFTNTNANYSLEDVNVSIVFFDSEANEASEKFFVRLDEASGLINGELPPRKAARFKWLIIPKIGAAEEFRSRYYVIANVTARLGSTTLVFETWPAVIEVEPVPQLELDYVIPRKVYGDDPYTPEVEPPVPFVLGVRVRNVGYGEARNLRIASAQPRIERSNYPGVYIDFRIIGTFLNGRKIPNGLTIDFGDLGPGESSTAAWIMTAEVTGDFVYYNATFRHSDELGGEETSLIRAVRTHFLFRAFNDTSRDDGMMDFLVDDDGDGVPELIIDSDGGDYVVLAVGFTEEYGRGFRKIVPSVNSPDWIYLAVPVGGYTRAVRSDGGEPIAQWIENGTLHILDLGSPEFYVLKANRPPIPVVTVGGELIVNRTVVLDASLSYDPDGRIVRYLWSIGNESFDGPVVNYTFSEPGNHTVVLTVWDDENASASLTKIVEVHIGPRFEVEAKIFPDWGVIPFNITAVLNVTNVGDTEGTYTSVLLINGEVRENSSAIITPNSSHTFTFIAEISEIGEHNVSINGFSKLVKAYMNVTKRVRELMNSSKYFGYYDSLVWDGFRSDFEEWANWILANVSVSSDEFDDVYSITIGNWSLTNYEENLTKTSKVGWIRAVYERNATVIGTIGWNYTTLYLTTRVELYANATHRLDDEPPALRVAPESGIYADIPEFNVTVCDESNVTVWGERGNATKEFNMVSRNGTCSLWTGSLPLGLGNNTVTIKARDEFGNEANETLWIYINPQAPIIYIESPEGRVYNTREVWFNYTVVDYDLMGVKAYLDGYLISTSLNASLKLNLSYGWHNFTVTAWDISYNISKSVMFRINEPPVANFTWNASYLAVNFISTSYDEDGIVKYHWDFGDGLTSTEASPLHVYTEGGIYNVTLTVWDSYNASSSMTKTVEVIANVSKQRTERYNFSRYFGFYNTTSWDGFRSDFEEWANWILANVSVSSDEFDDVYSITIGNWSLTNYEENLTIGTSVGWIKAIYQRTAIVDGLIDHNETELLILQIVEIYANATHVPDDNPPVIVILYPESKTYDHNVTIVEVEVYDESPIEWVKAELDGVSYNLTSIGGRWIANITASDGNHTLIVMASDIYGNIGSANLSFAVNTSIKILEEENTTVTIIPGDAESEVEIENDTVNVIITLQGVSHLFTLPKQSWIIIDERTLSAPWLMIYSNARMMRTFEEISQITREAGVYNIKQITMEVNISEGGYAVVMVPLHGMRPVSVVVEKNSTEYELTTERKEYGYFGVFGNYLYIVIFDDPIIKVTLEQLDEEKTATLQLALWRNLGFVWRAYYLRLKKEFEELLSNITDTSVIQDALALHEQAEIYFNEAESYDPMTNPVMYSIYMRKAYITEKEALNLLKRLIG